MSGRLITNALLAAIAFILIFRWWPTLGVAAIFIAASTWIYFVLKARRARLKAEKDARLRIEVEPLYQEYLGKRGVLREKYDPEHKWSRFGWNEPGMPEDYSAECAALAEAYKGVLVIKFGDSVIKDG